MRKLIINVLVIFRANDDNLLIKPQLLIRQTLVLTIIILTTIVVYTSDPRICQILQVISLFLQVMTLFLEVAFPAYSIYSMSYRAIGSIRRRGNTTKYLVPQQLATGGTNSSIASDTDYDFDESARERHKSISARLPSTNRKNSTYSTNK